VEQILSDKNNRCYCYMMGKSYRVLHKHYFLEDEGCCFDVL
jgi:hypothetical protein